MQMELLVLIQFYQQLHLLAAVMEVVKAKLVEMVVLVVVEVVMQGLQAAQETHQALLHLKVAMVVLVTALPLTLLAGAVVVQVKLVLLPYLVKAV
jgi:hypothetical protein